jgi:hypothetical protein
MPARFLGYGRQSIDRSDIDAVVDEQCYLGLTDEEVERVIAEVVDLASAA